MATPRHSNESGSVARSAVIIAAVVTGFALVWLLRSVVLLAFAAMLFGVVFHSVAARIAKSTRLGHALSLTLAVILLLVAIVAPFYLFGNVVTAQMQALVLKLPSAWAHFRQHIGHPELDVQTMSQLRAMIPDGGSILSAVSSIVGSVGSAVSGIILALISGIYLAAAPDGYVDGLVELFPGHLRPQIRAGIEAGGLALRKWLLGQMIAMLIVGLLVGIGLWALGIPSPLALGLIAGMLEFVPTAGPIASAIPAILIAFSLGWERALLACGLFLVIQQIEGNVISPQIQRRTVDLPPALTLFSLLAFALLFGMLGIILAAPLTVILFVWVRMFVRREMPSAKPLEAMSRSPGAVTPTTATSGTKHRSG